MRKRLDPATIAQIQAGHRKGATYADLADRHGVSQGSVRNALLAAAPPAKPLRGPRAQPAAVEEDDGLGALDVLTERLLRDAEADGNLPGVATIGRLRVALAEHRRKAAPPPSLEQDGMMLVPVSDMVGLAKKARDRLHAYVETSPEERLACSRCGHTEGAS